MFQKYHSTLKGLKVAHGADQITEGEIILTLKDTSVLAEGLRELGVVRREEADAMREAKRLWAQALGWWCSTSHDACN